MPRCLFFMYSPLCMSPTYTYYLEFICFCWKTYDPLQEGRKGGLVCLLEGRLPSLLSLPTCGGG